MKKVFSLLLILMLVLSFTLPATAAGKVKTTVTLSHTGVVTLALGQTIQITATVTPDAPVTWSSKKAKIATVDGSGNVTGAGEGTTTIIAKAGAKSAKVKVKVVDPNKPDSISFAQGKALTVNMGQPVQLNAVLAPATAQATLTWKSGKATVATIDAAGVLNPLAEGKTKVTVTTHNKKKATIAVTVVDPYKPTKVVIPQGKSAALIAGQTLQLSANLEPATAQANLTWTSSKPGVAVVDANGLVTAVGKGKAKITVQAANYMKTKATIIITVLANSNDSFGKDLSVCYGKNAKNVANRYDLTNDSVVQNDLGFLLTLKNQNVSMKAQGPTQSLENGIINSVIIEGKSDYNICGTRIGMKKQKAHSTVKNRGWNLFMIDQTGAIYVKDSLCLMLTWPFDKVEMIVFTDYDRMIQALYA